MQVETQPRRTPGYDVARQDPRSSRSLLGRAFAILDACAEAEPGLTLAGIGRACELPKSSAHRLVTQLVDLGALEHDGNVFGLSGRMFALGSSAPQARRLRELASPFLEELYARTHETVHLGMLDGLSVLYVDTRSGRRSGHAEGRTRIGSRMPLLSTVLGKAILAAGPQKLIDEVLVDGREHDAPETLARSQRLLREVDIIRRRGVAFDHGESYAGVSCVAAPLDLGSQRCLAAISLAAPTPRFRPQAFGDATMLYARAISRALRQHPPS